MIRVIVSQSVRPALVVCLVLAACGCASILFPHGPSSLGGPSTRLGYALAGPIHTVVVDAGHGGKDPGASYFGLKEKELTLDMARRLKTELQQAGLRVVMTRESDRFVSLKRRPGVANRSNAGLFVSLHVNANRNRRVSGAEVYYPRESVVSSGGRWPPSVTPSEIGVSSPTIRQVLWDLVLGRTRSHSRHLASTVCGTLKGSLRVRCKVKAARFVVLREAQMPAVLVEVGYVSNHAESRRLKSVEYRSAAARAIAQGIVSYIRTLGTQHI